MRTEKEFPETNHIGLEDLLAILQYSSEKKTRRRNIESLGSQTPSQAIPHNRLVKTLLEAFLSITCLRSCHLWSETSEGPENRQHPEGPLLVLSPCFTGSQADA